MIEKILNYFGYEKKKERDWKETTREILKNIKKASISVYPDEITGKYVIDFDDAKIEIKSKNGDRVTMTDLVNSEMVSCVTGGIFRRVE